MKLLYSSDEFKILTQPYPGLPLILDKSMNIVRIVLDFFVFICIRNGKVKSKGTWTTYGRAIYDFLSYCEANEHDWRKIDVTAELSIIAIYRDWSTGKVGLSASTVNSRLGVIKRFYSFAYERGVVKKTSFDITDLKLTNSRKPLSNIDSSGGRKSDEMFLNQPSTQLEILSTRQAWELLQKITNKTVLLITKLAITSGLRKEELLTFPIDYIVDPSKYPNSKLNFRVNISPQHMKIKNKKARGIDIPRNVMQELWNYIKFERNERANMANNNDKNILFLNQHGKAWACGGRGLNKVYSDLNLEFKIKPHILRHTYATHLLYVLSKRKPPFEPLIYVRDRMGHSSVKTTEQYLHYLELVEDEIMDEIQLDIAAHYEYGVENGL